MRHIFIDLGCSDGGTIEQFKNWRSLAFPKEINWEIFGFDPLPYSWKISGAKIEQKAAWIEDGEIELSKFEVLDASSVMRDKVGWDKGEIHLVPCFDFSKWLTSFDDCYVVVKMDIEGAEFKVLEKCLEDGTAEIMNVLLCEFHPNKVITYTTQDKLNLIEKLEDQNVEVAEWH